MKATLEFYLPEENGEFDTAIKAGRYRSALWDFSQALRCMIKYGDGEDEKRVGILQEVRARLNASLDEHGVDLDE